jgi:Zn-dependent M16 (insulinase) family peptidase
MHEPDKVTVSFYVHFEKVPEENVQKLKLEINNILSELAKKYSPEDILVTLIWY